jgi:hypothetical protein
MNDMADPVKHVAADCHEAISPEPAVVTASASLRLSGERRGRHHLGERQVSNLTD